MLRRNERLTFLLSLLIVVMGSLFIFGRGQAVEPKRSDNRNISGCTANDLSGEIDHSERFAFFENERMQIPTLAYVNNTDTNVLGVASEERWIEIDLSEQKLYAWEGNRLFLETLISTGLPWTPTPTGEFRIWIKLRATKMEGGKGAYYYYLPNVPYVMYFENDMIPGWKGYGLHGTYWHSDFGNQRSHGCVNLPTSIAEKIYYWASPVLSTGRSSIKSTGENQGTRIVIHE